MKRLMVAGLSVASISLIAAISAYGPRRTHAYCTLPADPAPTFALLEACDVRAQVPSGRAAAPDVPTWYRIRSERGDPNIGATDVICSDDGTGCTDRVGLIARYMRENGIPNVQCTVESPQEVENHNSSPSGPRLARQQQCVWQVEVGIKEEGVK